MQPLNREKKMDLNKMKKAELIALVEALRAEIAKKEEERKLLVQKNQEFWEIISQHEIRIIKAEQAERSFEAEVASALAVWPASRPIHPDLLGAMQWSRCQETGHLKLRVQRAYYLENNWVRKFLAQFQEYARNAGHHAFLGRDGAGGFLRISAKPI